MTDRPDNNTNREEREPYVPASPVKRIASPVKRIMAWVGIVYMVGLVILNIYPFFNQGNYLTGIAPLFACPGIAGIFAISLYLARHPDSTYSRKVSMAILAVLCAVGFVVSLILGVPPLLANFGI